MGSVPDFSPLAMIDHIDHIVLTTRDKDACIRFYTEVR
jgi:hypothetical protein